MRLNKNIITLISADLFLYSGWGLFSPIYAIFVTDQIRGGGVEIVGFAVGTFWIVKSIFQPFLANFLDIKKGERDDFAFLIFGTMLASIVPLGYFFATRVIDLFILEAIRGIAMACVVPAWFGIFTRHINKDWYAFTWSVQSTALGMATGFSALFGGIIASFLGFRLLFIFVSFLGFCGAFMLFYVREKIISADPSDETLLSPEDFS